MEEMLNLQETEEGQLPDATAAIATILVVYRRGERFTDLDGEVIRVFDIGG